MHKQDMKDNDWKVFFQTGRRILGAGALDAYLSDSWCAFTTFSSIKHGAVYFNCGFPQVTDCLDTCVRGGGTWRREFEYSDLAHIVVPATFYWEWYLDRGFRHGNKHQDITRFSKELRKLGIKHRKTDLVLEIKLY